MLLIFSFAANGQIINFDDQNFKSILLSANVSNGIARNSLNQPMVIDTNGNNEIEVAESEQVYQLSIAVNSDVGSLAGIEFFSNLTNLFCIYNLLTELDVSALSNLTNLELGNNQLTGLDVSGLPNLKYLTLSNNQLETLEINPQLETLICPNNSIVSLDLSQSVALRRLSCWNNNLTELNLSNAQELYTLSCQNNQLTALHIQSLQLIYIDCSNNLLTDLDLTDVGISNSAQPIIIYCRNNLLTTIDTTVTENSKVQLHCDNNPNLVSLYLKNGESFYDNNAHEPPYPSVHFDDNFNLELICADEFNYEYLQTKLDQNGITDCELISDCLLETIDYEKDSFSFYPNPIKDVLTINYPSEYNYLVVYNIVGQIVHETYFEHDNPIVLDFLSSGNYIAKVSSESATKQFIIVKE